MLDPLACDLHVAEFVPTTSERGEAPQVPARPVNSGVTYDDHTGTAEQEPLSGRRGRAKKIVAPSTRQLRKRSADDIAENTDPVTVDDGPISKKVKKAVENDATEVQEGGSGENAPTLGTRRGRGGARGRGKGARGPANGAREGADGAARGGVAGAARGRGNRARGVANGARARGARGK